MSKVDGFCSGSACDNKVHANVRTIGHIDHGKTTLTSAITSYLSRQGMAEYRSYKSLNEMVSSGGVLSRLAHVEYSTETHHFSHIDYPQHVDCIRDMISGVPRIDCAILVVSAMEGLKSQAREHLMLASQAGVENVIVFINKVDAIMDAGIIDLVEMETRELLDRCQYDGAKVPCVRGSATCALENKNPEIGEERIQELVTVLMNNARAGDVLEEESFLFSVEEAMMVPGRGLMVLGYIEAGGLRVGDEVELVGHGIKHPAVCTGIENSGEVLRYAQAGGGSLKVTLEGLEHCDIQKGQFLCMPGSVQQCSNFEAHLYIFTREEGGRGAPFFSHHPVKLRYGSSAVEASLELPATVVMVMPGDDVGSVKVRLLKKVALYEGLRFTIQDYNKTIGCGMITRIIQ